MGTEILVVFLIAPIVLWIFDVLCILRQRKVFMHVWLLGIGVAILSYLTISSYLAGYNPMQGFVIGSVFYAPGYLIIYLGLSFLTKVNGSKEGKRSVT
jgi:hypothetical protein